jgi:hypothetical protein
MQTTQTILLQGGLDLITPQVTMPPGRAIAAINYEPDVNGYTSTNGYERYDGRPSPSDGMSPDDIAARRAAIAAVPGTGPVRGVAVYNGAVWAFRDQNDGSGAMFKSTPAGWVKQTFGSTLVFNTGTAAFTEGTVVTGGTSGATATIQRVVIQSGAWDGSAAGFLVLSGVTGTFSAAETITATPGSAKAGGAQAAITLPPNGIYEFVTHNFYGAAKSLRLYFANGVGTAFEWDGTVLAPIKSGTSTGTTFSYLLTAGGPPDRVLTAAGDRIIMGSDDVDNPAYIDEFRNHLFLGYSVGALVFSGPGLPLDYRTIAGAGTFAFGDDMTGMLSVAASLVVYGRGLIEYVAGNSVDDFQKLTVTAAAGAVLRTSAGLRDGSDIPRRCRAAAPVVQRCLWRLRHRDGDATAAAAVQAEAIGERCSEHLPHRHRQGSVPDALGRRFRRRALHGAEVPGDASLQAAGRVLLLMRRRDPVRQWRPPVCRRHGWLCLRDRQGHVLRWRGDRHLSQARLQQSEVGDAEQGVSQVHRRRAVR